MRAWIRWTFLTTPIILSACSTGPAVISEELKSQIDPSISFSELLAAPNTYVGRTVLLGGTALKARRTKDRTEIEILQLPLVANQPSDQRSKSEGRFIALRSGEFLDPAIIERDAPVTVVGEVKGAIVKPLDQGEYQYPVVEIKQLINWKELQRRDRTAGYGGGYGYPYGPYGYGPMGYYGDPFYDPYGYGGFYPYYYGRGRSSLAPSPPPRSSSVPPRVQKRR